MGIKTEPRHQGLLEDKDVARWHATNAKSARSTADNYLRQLGLFCQRTGTTPRGLLAMRQKARDDLATDFINNPDYKNQRTVVKAVKSWLVFNGKDFERKFKYSRIEARPRVDRMRVPAPEELRKVLDAADTRARAAISVLAFGGQRLQVMGNYRGTEGLRLRDFEDIVLNGSVRFEKVPCRVRIRRELSKTAHEFFTFIGGKGLGYIASYLNERIAAGELLTLDSPLITPKQVQRAGIRKAWAEQEKKTGKKLTAEQREKVGRVEGAMFIRTINIGDLIRKPMRAAEMSHNPPYIWRSYFSSHLARATTLSKDDKEFFMGHTGDVSRKYSHEKALTPQQIEGMRNGYLTSSRLIETFFAAPERSDEEIDAIQREEEQKYIAKLQEQQETLDRMAELDAELRRRKEELDALAARLAAQPAPTQRASQKVADAAELEGLLAEGWTFVAVLPNGKIVVKKGA